MSQLCAENIDYTTQFNTSTNVSRLLSGNLKGIYSECIASLNANRNISIEAYAIDWKLASPVGPEEMKISSYSLLLSFRWLPYTENSGKTLASFSVSIPTQTARCGFDSEGKAEIEIENNVVHRFKCDNISSVNDQSFILSLKHGGSISFTFPKK